MEATAIQSSDPSQPEPENPHRHHTGKMSESKQQEMQVGNVHRSGCCETADPGQQSACDESMDCSSCPSFGHALASVELGDATVSLSYRPVLHAGTLVPSFDYPPYRPPIS
ncbi:MAG TPA: hypothetical protein VFG52_03965 [Xanthomonadales bacterium]|nr:hypothetical protein [Xanthomonadales bacterium]